MPTDDPMEQVLAPFQFKGLVGSRVPVGTRTNDMGQQEHVYAVTGDPEWGEAPNSQTSYEYEYIQWHQTYHAKASVRDPRCRICNAEQAFQEQRRPHDQYHRPSKQYDPTCRFCQDDRFLGRM